MRDLMVEVGDIEVRVRVEDGEGPPMLFTSMGWGVSVDLYLAGLTGLRDRFTVAWVDPRGTGRSGRPADTDWSLDPIISDFDQVRQVLDWEQMWVAGHSMGGHLALRYAATYPEHCAGVLALCAYGDMDDQFWEEMNTRIEARADEPWFKKTVEAFTRDVETDEQFARKQLDRLPMYFVDQSKLEDFLADTGSVTWTLDAYNYLTTNPDMAVLDQLDNVALPAVVISADGDFICSPPLGLRIHQTLVGSVFVEITKSGHFPWVEQPQAFWEALDTALNKVSPHRTFEQEK